MTPKQEERIRNKIKRVKAALAADKKQWGGMHHDGQGLRYYPPQLYIQLGDYTGGLRYFNWFQKNFPDDYSDSKFLFEWAVVLFKRKRLKEAEKKSFLVYTNNTYVFDKFFGREIIPIDKYEGSNLEGPDFAMGYFNYSHEQENLTDFADWLSELIATESFKQKMDEFVEIHKQLENEHDVNKRSALLDQASQMRDA